MINITKSFSSTLFLLISFSLGCLVGAPLHYTKELIEKLEHAVNHTSEKTIKSYGLWDSPITAERIAQEATYISEICVDGDMTYLCELRPANHGYYTIVRLDSSGHMQDMTPSDFNVRTFVHEYGGGAFTVSNSVIYASNGQNGAIYCFQPNRPPQQITKGQIKLENGQYKGTRFADLHLTSFGLVAIGEEHNPDKPIENFLALIDISTGNFKKLASGNDFYASPAISEDEKQIAWISWNHGNMPWTNTQLWMASFDEHGGLKDMQQICGDIPEAIFQPQWSSNGILYFVSDRSKGWWNLHRYVAGQVENVCPMEAEMAEPLWSFGISTYAFLGDKIVFTYNSKGRWQLAFLNPETKQWQNCERDSIDINQVRSGKGFVQFLEQYADRGEALIQIDDAVGYPAKALLSEGSFDLKEYLSIPQHISYPSHDRIAHGYYYAPQNKDFKAPDGEKPPLIVMVHGGPTAQTTATLKLRTQFWTSRGFAVLDVNYGGSTGYGREYRSLLDRNLGVVDVEDCENGALFLAYQGLVDKNKLLIRGGSAGGYTTLAAMAFTKTFKGGASYFGISDLEVLEQDGHKFELHYTDQLVGKYPQEKELWRARSPIHFVDAIKSPLILFQGADDAIVPPNQSILIYEALKQREIPVELHIYPGEGHGFRQSQNIIHSLKREAEFYSEILGLKQA